MKITRVNETGTFANQHGIQARKLFDSPKATVVHMKLNPGESLKSHVTPVDVFFYVLEGEPEIEIGSERIRMSPDTLIESPANIAHCVYNESSDKAARFLVVKLG